MNKAIIITNRILSESGFVIMKSKEVRNIRRFLLADFISPDCAVQFTVCACPSGKHVSKIHSSEMAENMTGEDLPDMIAFIKGEIAAVSEDQVVIDTGNIGYNVRISTGTAGRLPGPGQEIKLYTYTHIREDIFQLYGFLTADDLDIFKQLITVNGIGPKGGLAVLSVMNADDLRLFILTGDARGIAKAPGIGIKTAERIILDLRDKIALHLPSGDDGLYGEANTYGFSGSDSTARNEAVEALTALGYGSAEALKAVKKACTSEEKKDGQLPMDAEAILKVALKYLY